MAKCLYKNTHYSAAIDPKRTIKINVFKGCIVRLSSYGMPFYDIRWSVAGLLLVCTSVQVRNNEATYKPQWETNLT